MRNKRGKKIRVLLMSIIVGLFIFPGKISANERAVLSTEPSEAIVSIAFPVIPEGEAGPFDFILDPQRLVYKTDAMRYGGGEVEEGATVLFRNKEGHYDFSKYSDNLTVVNYSTVPVLVTISAQIHELGEIELSESDDFSNSEVCNLYLAIVDNVGNVQPLSMDEEVSITFEMQAAPKNAYTYRLDEDTQTYRFDLAENAGEIDFAAYSFGLVGACNPNANWQNVDVYPLITVNWYIEPILTEAEVNAEDKNAEVQDESVGDVLEEEMKSEEDASVSGNDAG